MKKKKKVKFKECFAAMKMPGLVQGACIQVDYVNNQPIFIIAL